MNAILGEFSGESPAQPVLPPSAYKLQPYKARMQSGRPLNQNKISYTASSTGNDMSDKSRTTPDNASNRGRGLLNWTKPKPKQVHNEFTIKKKSFQSTVSAKIDAGDSSADEDCSDVDISPIK